MPKIHDNRFDGDFGGEASATLFQTNGQVVVTIRDPYPTSIVVSAKTLRQFAERMIAIADEIEGPTFTTSELSALADQGMKLTDEEAHRIAMARNTDNSGEAPC